MDNSLEVQEYLIKANPQAIEAQARPRLEFDRSELIPPAVSSGHVARASIIHRVYITSSIHTSYSRRFAQLKATVTRSAEEQASGCHGAGAERYCD